MADLTIKTIEELAAALKEVDEIMKLDPLPERDKERVLCLTDAIAKYEAEHPPKPEDVA